jgi:Ca2+-transporting ATPase
VKAVAGIALQLLVVYVPFLQKPFGTVPLTAIDWMVVLLISSAVILLLEWFKWMYHSARVR